MLASDTPANSPKRPSAPSTGNHRGASTGVQPLVGIGFCGALTTYSTFSCKTMRLAETGARLFAVANLTASVVAGLGAMFLGSAVAEALWATG